MILTALGEAQQTGARLQAACEVISVSARTIQRWKRRPDGDDRRFLGNEIATLVNEEKQPGTYEVEWNAGEFPSGVYFYQLKAGDFVQTRKFLLVR